MQNTVYRASRLPIFYAIFMLAGVIQVWSPPGTARASVYCIFSAHMSSISLVFPKILAVLQSKSFAYALLGLLAWDTAQALRKRPLCFSISPVVQAGLALLLSLGLVGMVILAYAKTLDAAVPLHLEMSGWRDKLQLCRVLGHDSWWAVGLLFKLLGCVGALLVLCFGRRAPGR